MNPPSVPQPHAYEYSEAEERPVTVAHIFRVLHKYLPVIVLSMISVAILYLIVATAIYLLAPSARTTFVTFRLDFEGASEGMFPNDLKFAPTDIVATPILLHVYQANQLDRFMTFDRFAKSVSVLESNPEYEKLSTRYRARLADPKLSTVDRERIEKEYDLALASISKHGYALHYIQDKGKRPPETVVRKALIDILNRWADVAVNQQHVLSIDARRLSPAFADDPAFDQGNVVIAIQILRSRIWQVRSTILALERLPGSQLAVTREGVSLEEVALRLEELVRFRLEALAATLGPGAIGDTGTTLQLLQNQLAYDERALKSAQGRAEAIRQTLAIYSREEQGTTVSKSTPAPTTTEGGSETVMPQLSDTFLDRLVGLVGQAQDLKFRQGLTDDFHNALRNVIPLQEAVAYDRELIAQVQSPGGRTRDQQSARAELVSIRAELRVLIKTLNDLHAIISRTLYPTSQLLTVTAPPVTRVERSLSMTKLGVFGILTLLVGLAATVVAVLLHDRMREEEEEVTVTEDGTTVHEPAI
jgi:hypothetical protein